MSTTTPPHPRRPGRRWLLPAALIVAAGVGAGVWYFGGRPGPAAAGDPVAASHANARGIGWMEQFEYAKAAAEFEEAGRLAPGWLPAKINLGIAQYNSVGQAGVDDPVLDRALEAFAGVLKDDPGNVHAHFNTGVVLRYRGLYDQAAPHFRKVVDADPADPHAWYYLATCTPIPRDDPAAEAAAEAAVKAMLEKALELSPYLNSARYALAQHPNTPPADRDALFAEFRALQAANWEEENRDRYSELGRYASVVGKAPAPPPAVGPAPGFAQQPAVTVPLPAPPADPLRDAARDRFGGVLVRLDYNADGRPDLLLLSAAGRAGQARDVLLRNDGGKLTDVSAEAGLAAQPGSLGCAVGDFDNDGLPDLALTGPAGVRLLRNADGARFEDKTAAAGFDKLGGVCLPAQWVDLDQDGDLDLVVGRYADTADQAANQLRGGGDAPAGGWPCS